MRRSAREGIDAAWKRMDEHWREYESLPHGPEALRLWSAMKAPWGEWRTAIERALRAVEEHRRLADQGLADGSAELVAAEARAWAAYQEARRLFAPAEAAIGAVLDRTEQDVAAAKAAGEAAVKTGATVIAVAIVVGALVLLAIGVALSRSISGVLRALLAESKKLTDAVQAGNLDVRGDVASVTAEFQPIIDGMNHTVDAFVRPIRVTADYVDRIAKGDVPPRIRGPHPRVGEAGGEGEVTAKHVNEQLGHIASGITKVTDIVGELAASAREQAAGIDQLTKAVSQMDKVTQQNAASSEESSSAAAELSGQSEELAAMVGGFQLDRAAKTVVRPAAAAAPLAARATPARPSFQPLARS